MIFQDKVVDGYEILYSDSEDNTLDISINSNSEFIDTDNGELVDVLHPEEIRWFYKILKLKKNNCLKAFNAYDSLRLETKSQELCALKCTHSMESEMEKIVVKKNLFEVDVRKRICNPIYWTDEDDTYKVFRGTWFKSETYFPLSEPLADAIESQHMTNFGSLSRSWCVNLSNKKRRVLHSFYYKDKIIIWYGLNDVYMYSNKAATRFVNKWKILSPGVKISRGYKSKARFEDRPTEITHLCFVVHGIGQKLECKINKDCHKLKYNCKQILKSHFNEDQIRDFRIEFLPIEWRTGLNLDGGIIDSITPNEFKGLRTILNSTIMDILYYSSSLYRTEITQGLEFEMNRLYSMFCARNPYFETKGGKVSILAHSLGSVICYDIIRSWMFPCSDFDCPISMNSLESEEILRKKNQIQNAKKRIQQLEEEIRSCLDIQGARDVVDGLRIPNFPSNFKEGSIWKKVTEIDNFFTMGSPLPVFLALRGLKPHGLNTQQDILPTSVCRRIFNIFHPSDPVAYRLEPLIIEEYRKIRPVHIEFTFKNVNDQSSDTQSELKPTTGNCSSESVTANTEKVEDVELDSVDNVHVKVCYSHRQSNMFSEQISETIKKLNHRRKSIIPAVEEFQIKMKNIKALPFFQRIAMFVNILKGEDVLVKNKNKTEDGDSSYEPTMSHETLEHRLDFTIGDKQSLLSFISLFTSHTSYWSDQNLAKFILDQVLSDHKGQSAD